MKCVICNATCGESGLCDEHKYDEQPPDDVYQLWWVPSRAAEGFKWEPRLIGEYTSLEDAQFDRHIEVCDEPSPDKHEFMSWHIEKVRKQ